MLGGVITLLVAANGKAQAYTCSGIVISINNGGGRIYVEKEDVLKGLQKTANGSIVNKPTSNINLATLERSLEANPWIRDAELYFDTKDVLHVAVLERVPFARVFTTAGSSFYIDSAGRHLPLLESYSAKLPVVTGFTAAKRFTAADSILLQETKEVVRTISSDEFWNAQVGQIDITPERKFELIPLLGSHVIKLGSGNNTAAKLAKLMVFYKQVLPKAGFAKYSALDVQFDGQVVAVKRGAVSKVDSIQLMKNIAELMERKVAEQEPDEIVQAAPVQAALSNGDFDVEPETKDTLTAKPVREKSTVSSYTAPVKTSLPVVTTTPVSEKPAPKKTAQQPTKPAEKPKAATKPAAPKPKAVMQRNVENEY